MSVEVGIWLIIGAVAAGIFLFCITLIFLCRLAGRPEIGIVAIIVLILAATLDYFWNWSSIRYPHMAFGALTEIAPVSIPSMSAAVFLGIYLADR